jgi:hypothetical protein
MRGKKFLLKMQKKALAKSLIVRTKKYWHFARLAKGKLIISKGGGQVVEERPVCFLSVHNFRERFLYLQYTYVSYGIVHCNSSLSPVILKKQIPLSLFALLCFFSS